METFHFITAKKNGKIHIRIPWKNNHHVSKLKQERFAIIGNPINFTNSLCFFLLKHTHCYHTQKVDMCTHLSFNASK